MEGVRVVGLADTNKAAARRLGERYSIQNIHGSLEALLSSTTLDVLHILTPPAHHYVQAMVTIDHGVSVFIEKPMTLRSSEVVELYNRATARGVSVCPDFLQLFHPCMRRAISLVNSGRFGRIVYLESHSSLDLDIPELHESTRPHWSYKLPGGVLHNYVTHPLYLVLYWVGAPKRVIASPRSFGTMPQGLTDHLDIMLEGDRVSGYVTLSLVTKPCSYYVRLFCENGSLLVNFYTMTVVVERKSRLPSAVNRAMTNFRQAYQLSRGTIGNVIDSVRGRLVAYHGLQILLREYYTTIKEGRAPPVSPALAIAVSETEEAVLAQAGKVHLDNRRRPSVQRGIERSQRVLVTGATGYLGTEVVRQLVGNGYYVRALVRAVSHTDGLEQLGVELVYGDVREHDNLCEAARGMDIVVHMAAGLRGTKDFIIESCVAGTRNVAEVARARGIKRVIYISSMSVYDSVGVHSGGVITEESPLEAFPELRGVASMAKRQAEDVALTYLKDRDTPWTILRPSLIFGNGRDILSLLGMKVGNNLLCFGTGSKHLGLIQVKDVGMAIVKVIQTESTRGRVFNVSHQDAVTIRECIRQCIRKSQHKNIWVLCVPYAISYCGVVLLGILRWLTGKGPRVTTRQLASLYRDSFVDTSAIRKETGWRPRERLLAQLLEEVRRCGSRVVI